MWAGFRLVEPLGQGAGGTVHRALDPESGREVALKVLQPEADPERLRREGLLAADLDHPGIVRLVRRGEEGGVPWIAYELVRGARTLDQELRALPRERGVRVLLEVARALSHAHSRGVIHRDLKPANVLIDETGRARLTDFGLARGEGLPRMTQSGLLVGTAAYMAPEQLRGEVSSLGPWTDVWAFGVMLYEVLTGRPAFETMTLAEHVGRVHARPPDPPRQVDPTVPVALERVCLRALALAPERRQPDGGALAEELDRALRGASASPLRLTLAGLGAGVALLVGLVGWLGGAGDVPAQGSPAPVPSRGGGRSEMVESVDPVASAAERASAAARAAGEDPARPLEEALRQDPTSTRLRLLLARLWLERGLVEQASLVLEPARGDSQVRPLSTAISALSPLDPSALERLDEAAQAEAAPALVEWALLAQAAAMRLQDPRWNPPPHPQRSQRALEESVLLTRLAAEAAAGGPLEGRARLVVVMTHAPGSPEGQLELERARALLPPDDPLLLMTLAGVRLGHGDVAGAREALVSLPTSWRRGRLTGDQLRAAIALRSGEPALAADILAREVTWAVDDADVVEGLVAAARAAGRSAEAERAERHALALRGAEREQVSAEVRALGNELLLAGTPEQWRELLRRDPLFHCGRHQLFLAELSRVRQMELVRQALRQGVLASRWDGKHVTQVMGAIQGLETDRPGGAAAVLAEHLSIEDGLDRLLRALLGVCELLDPARRGGQGRRAVADRVARDAQSVLAEDPADPLARTLLAAAELERDRPAVAQAELEVVLTMDPEAHAAGFLYILTLARRRASVRRVAEQVAAMRGIGVPWTDPAWNPQAWPELGPYLDQPGFEQLRR